MRLPAVPEQVDPASVTEVLDGRWAQVRREARDHLAKFTIASAEERSTADYRAAVFDRLRDLAGTGWQRRGFDPEYGGLGDVGGSIVSFEMLGFADLSLMVKAGVQWGLFGGAVQLLGTREHHQRYLPGIMDLTLPGCFAMTETGHGSDVQHLGTTATYDAQRAEFVLDTPTPAARKDYIGNAARDGLAAVVFAQLIVGDEQHGVHAFVVPIRDADGNAAPGVSIGDCGVKGGLNGVDNGRISFDHVRVPRTALLDRYGSVGADGTYRSPIESSGRRFFTMLGTLVRGRVSVAGFAGSATKRALAIALRYAQQRRQFERSPSQAADGGEVVLLDYRAHQRKLLPALATSYALHFAQEELVTTLHEVQSGGITDERGQRELEARAAGIKAVASWHATATIQTCREACGGAGYLAENLLTTLKADTDVFTTFEGDNTVLLQLLAKGLLTSYREHVSDLGALGTARFMAEQVVDTVIERTAAHSVIEAILAAGPGRTDEDALFDRAWQLHAFEDREQHVLDGLARRLRRASGASPEDAFEVFNNAQDHVLRAARVHVDRVVLEAFVAAIDRCADEQAAALLDRVCDLYVLSTIEKDLAWFLGHDRLTSARGKVVTSAVNELCAALRPHAATLVDAFAIPPELLDAAMLHG
ncbi:MAG TPA: acyl-CoA dehydrogenase [Pseudonocardiaceae bacterium]|nr:acyl-CoA dehydrogenase [Pseudonocardiaceae bacterium]